MTTPDDPTAPGEPKSRPTPAVFFGHGSPMNALEQNRYTKSWATFGRTIPKPRAILVVSAHWYGNVTAVRDPSA